MMTFAVCTLLIFPFSRYMTETLKIMNSYNIFLSTTILYSTREIVAHDTFPNLIDRPVTCKATSYEKEK